MEELIMGDTTKIRKRGGCSPSSSVLQNYRFKRAILEKSKKKSNGGSSTPVPSWKMVGMRSPFVILRAAAASPRYPPKSGQTPPVSARKLGATLWELNEVPSPRVVEEYEDESLMEKRVGRREKMRRGLNHSGSLPPHLSDPSHSPISERMERSGTGSHRRRESSISRRLKTDHFDTVSNASFMEIETRSRCQTPSGGSTVGGKSRLKDVSSALTTSKELLKIISRMWGQEDRPSSSMSLISALHSELERARLQVNQLIHSENKEISDLLKRFAEEKATWKNKEQEMVETALESMAGELEVERKLMKRIESFNKKLGKELAETKASFMKVVKELENEKKAGGIIEQVCDELAANIGDDKSEMAEMKRETSRMQEEIEREREMLHIVEAMREERAQMKISDAKHQFEEKNASVDKTRNELEAFLRSNSIKKNGDNSVYRRRDVDLAFCREEARESDRGEVEDATDGENSGESDIQFIELNVSDPRKNYKVAHRNSKKSLVDEQTKGRKSIFKQVARRSTSLLRSVSNIVEWGNGSTNHETDKQVARRSCGDEVERYKSAKDVRNRTLPSSRFGLEREHASPSSQWVPPCPSREPCITALQTHMTIEGGGMRGRRDEDKVESYNNSRRSRR